jgi:hypothetical protein
MSLLFEAHTNESFVTTSIFNLEFYAVCCYRMSYGGRDVQQLMQRFKQVRGVIDDSQAADSANHTHAWDTIGSAD